MRWISSAMFVLATIAAVTVSISQARAEEYPWCAVYSGGRDDGGATNCGFVTYQQCMATIRGIGGWCEPNPRYPEVRVRPRKPRR